MSLSERPERNFSFSAVTGYLALIAIVAGFLALHIVASNIVLPGTKSTPAAAAPLMLSGD
jgi:hypothetical protein